MQIVPMTREEEEILLSQLPVYRQEMGTLMIGKERYLFSIGGCNNQVSYFLDGKDVNGKIYCCSFEESKEIDIIQAIFLGIPSWIRKKKKMEEK